MSLKIEGVTKRFGTHTAVDRLSITIPEQEIFGFLGANGASGKPIVIEKSTLSEAELDDKCYMKF